MLEFTSLWFLFFLIVAAGAFRICPIGWRPAYLLAVSYAFYLTYSPWAAILLATATAITWGAGLALGRSARSGLLAAGSAGILLIGIVAFYKVSGLAAPLGVSYYTFKLIGYLAEIYLERETAIEDPILFACFAAFFPFMVAGPIQRSADFFHPDPPASPDFTGGILRIATGLFKKLVIADGLGMVSSFAHPTATTPANAWLIFCLFPLQLYADFSGLTDIALGSATLFGVRGPENFNRPFSATSVGDYWRRWHMSLTTWLTDYVFTPLRMATRDWGRAGLVLSITINMILIALWHGVTWNYLIFGLLNAVFLIVDALTSQARRKFFKRNEAWKLPAEWLGWIYTIFLAAVTLVFFHAPSPAVAVALLRDLGAGMATLPAAIGQLLQHRENQPILVAGAAYIVMDMAERFGFGGWLRQALPQLPRPLQMAGRSAVAVLLAVGVMLMAIRATGQHNAFLYQQF